MTGMMRMEVWGNAVPSHSSTTSNSAVAPLAADILTPAELTAVIGNTNANEIIPPIVNFLDTFGVEKKTHATNTC